MTNVKVIILYEDTLKCIFVNNVFVEKIYIIQEKPIEDWFIALGNWKGLLAEIQRIVRDKDLIFSFEFYGTQKYKNKFKECINKYKLGDCLNMLPENDIKKVYMKKAKEYEELNCCEEAFNFYKISADYGKSTEAQFIIAEKYLENNIVKAIDYYKKAAFQGYAEAQYKLYFLFSQGKGVEKNRKEAIKWLIEAAKSGYVEAQLELGACYEYVEGIEKSNRYAMEWYQKAAQQGNSEGQKKLRFYYKDEKSLEREIKDIPAEEIEKIMQKRAEKSLRKEVNKLDKIVMRSIHHKKRPIVPYQTEHDEWQIRYDNLENLFTYLTEIYILKINGLESEIDNFFTKNGKPKKKVLDLDSSLFKKHSVGFGKCMEKLGVPEYTSTRSPIFKIRFVSLVYTNIIAYMDDIIESWYGFNNDNLHEWEIKEELFEDVIISDTDNFVAAYLNRIYQPDTDYMDEIMTIHQNFAIIDQDYNVKKAINILIKHSEELLNGTYAKRYQIRMKMSEDVIIDIIFKLAILLTTCTSKIPNEKMFPDKCKFKDKCLCDMIIELGKHIRHTEDCKIHILYKIFNQSKPSFRTRFKNLLNNEDFVAGCNAIACVGFIFGDSNIWKCIDKILA